MSMVLRSRRAALDFKNEITTLAHELDYECGYLDKYLADSVKLIRQSRFLSPDARMYSVEADDYFWSIRHNFYFSCSFISMLMQIAEDLVRDYLKSVSLLIGIEVLDKKIKKGFYEKVSISLSNNFELDLKSKWWAELCTLYQVRNAFVHQNGVLNPDYPERVNPIIDLTKRTKGIQIIEDRLLIDTEFCQFAIVVFKKALTALYKETNAHINILKKDL